MSLPWFKLNPKDFLDGVVNLPPDERAAYITVLCLMYQRAGALPDEPRWLAGHCLMSVRGWKSVRERLIAKGKIYVTADGRLMNERVVSELKNSPKLGDNLAETSAKLSDKVAETKKESNNIKGIPSTAIASECALDKELEVEGEANASLVEKSAKPKRKKTVGPAAFEALWLAYPRAKGRGSRPKSLAAWRQFDEDIQRRLPAAAARFKREGREPNAECGAMAIERWLTDEAFLDWLDGPDAQTQSTAKRFPDEPTRAAVAGKLGEDFARKWIDPCGWEPDRSRIVAPMKFVADQLSREGPALKTLGILAVRIAQAEGAAA